MLPSARLRLARAGDDRSRSCTPQAKTQTCRKAARFPFCGSICRSQLLTLCACREHAFEPGHLNGHSTNKASRGERSRLKVSSRKRIEIGSGEQIRSLNTYRQSDGMIGRPRTYTYLTKGASIFSSPPIIRLFVFYSILNPLDEVQLASSMPQVVHANRFLEQIESG